MRAKTPLDRLALAKLEPQEPKVQEWIDRIETYLTEFRDDLRKDLGKEKGDEVFLAMSTTPLSALEPLDSAHREGVK